MKKLVLALLLSSVIQLNAQTVTAGNTYQNYRDITPDSLLTYQLFPSVYKTYSLNVFGTSGYELKFTSVGSISSGGSQAHFKIASLNSDIYIRFGRFDSTWVPANQNWYVTKIAKPLAYGEQINTLDAIWDNTELYISDHGGSGGGNKNVNDFVGGDKYIGLKYIDIDNYNAVSYGWLRINCISEDSCYLKEYSTAAKMTGLSKNMDHSVTVYPNPTHGIFYLKSLNLSEIESINITDLYGKQINFTMETAADGTIISLEKNVAAGCYFLKCHVNNGVVMKKFLKTE